ncbi:pirin family protein [Fulvivirga sp. 29W222]|uniref:Pirin family protein n=1 Tax=Fulvivirga marina TaxID=2494733 RepID=A0A937G1A2_9BACT|nr:pirin family protein [Fulvivirga marina]MBL6448722.1 pirin family protein [Fulvivirga marina]
METIIHKAETRGKANLGWLDAHHTFSFGSYQDPARTQFGMLRVLNDDIVSAGAGFGTHPHNNMEIVSIPLSGSLEHRDSMGHTQVIRTNEVQLMSAGNGVLHSEYNHSKEEVVNFLQIWVLPKVKDIRPKYQQKLFDPADRANKIQPVVGPDGGDTLKINQDAYFSLGNFEAEYETSYKLHSDNNGVYIFIIEGEVEVAGESMERRDGIGVWEITEIPLRSLSKTELLLIEVPMTTEGHL